ncbi:MAG: membrane trafficking protein [Bacillota bacterium]|nr:membrane trafficking protein [Bacillota bacterium]
MNNPLNKKLSEIFGKMDEKVLQARLNAALEMLQNGNTEELAKKINKADKDDLISKINNFDDSKLKELNINKEDLKQKLQEEDLSKLSALIGDRGDEIINRIKSLINNS